MKNLYLYFVLLAGFFFCTAVEAQADEVPSTKPIIYNVQKGDCLYNIARHYGLSTRELYKLNKSQIKDPNLIRIGQKLIIGYETITTNNQPVINSVANASVVTLPSAEVLSSLTPTLNLDIPLDKLFVSTQESPIVDNKVVATEANFEEEVKTENVIISNRIRLNLVDQLRSLGLKCNTPYVRAFTLRQIENNIRVNLKRKRLVYDNGKSFELSEDGKTLYLKRSDYKQLLWICYGLNYTLYDCQDPRLIIMAEEMGMKYNTKEQYYSYEEIAASMLDSLDRKKVVYADIDEGEKRFAFNGKKIWLDCSAFAYFLSNLYGVEPVGQTTANIFTPRNGRRVIKSMEDLNPGDYVGRSGKTRGHVQVYIGNGMFAHSSGELPLFISKDEVKRKGRLFACSPTPNMELERIQNADGQSQQDFDNLASLNTYNKYSQLIKVVQ